MKLFVVKVRCQCAFGFTHRGFVMEVGMVNLIYWVIKNAIFWNAILDEDFDVRPPVKRYW